MSGLDTNTGQSSQIVSKRSSLLATTNNKDPDATSPTGSSSGGGAGSSVEGTGVVGVNIVGVSQGLRNATTSTYPLSTLIVVALIAFLLGSLLRSLISPADFIYVVKDLKDAEQEIGFGSGTADAGGTGMGTGWREIRRLLEVKYVLGGWDFQIAVVRRH